MVTKALSWSSTWMMIESLLHTEANVPSFCKAPSEFFAQSTGTLLKTSIIFQKDYRSDQPTSSDHNTLPLKLTGVEFRFGLNGMLAGEIGGHYV